MFRFKMSMYLLLKRIERADDYVINEIIKTLIFRQKKKYPTQELVVLSLPKYDREARCKQIDRMASMLKTYQYKEHCVVEKL